MAGIGVADAAVDRKESELIAPIKHRAKMALAEVPNRVLSSGSIAGTVGHALPFNGPS
jgi:hypothetical protein